MVRNCDEWLPLFGSLLDLRIIRGTYADALDPTYSTPRAAGALAERGVPLIDTSRPATGGGESTAGFLWISPRVTGGTAIQLSWPWLTDPGANSNLIGLRFGWIDPAVFRGVRSELREDA